MALDTRTEYINTAYVLDHDLPGLLMFEPEEATIPVGEYVAPPPQLPTNTVPTTTHVMTLNGVPVTELQQAAAAPSSAAARAGQSATPRAGSPAGRSTPGGRPSSRPTGRRGY